MSHTGVGKPRAQRWMRIGSVLVSFAAVALLGTAFRAHFYGTTVFSFLLTLVLIALCVAIGLHIRFLVLARREHCETVQVLDATERQYKSVFDNTLDGILILDDHGVCLDANPAVLALFGTSREELAGAPIERFFVGMGNFKEAWSGFLERLSEHREVRVLQGDGRTIVVEYAAKAHYLPGRHVVVVRDITRRKQTEEALRESEERFRQMSSNIQEIFWMLDVEKMQILHVNSAYETITGRTCESLEENPKSFEEAIHSQDRVRVLSRLGELVRTGRFDEEFRILRPDHSTRWVWVRGFPVRDSDGIVRRLAGTALDITARKSAEEQMARNLDLAQTARAEAEAFRKTGLALTQNLSMDYVLDTLLRSLAELVPCESAQVLLIEADTRLFLAREVHNLEPGRRVPRFPVTLDAQDNPFLMRALTGSTSLLISNTAEETGWADLRGFCDLGSWLCVPLLTSQAVLGLLSLGHRQPRAFTQEHLRLAKSLAIPAAVAIQNARLYERAEIFRAELEQRLAELQQAEKATEQARTLRERS